MSSRCVVRRPAWRTLRLGIGGVLAALAAEAAMAAGSAQAAEATAAAAPGRSYALVIGGMPGSPVYARRYRDWLTRFHAYATGPAAIAKDRVVVLSGDKDFQSPILSGPATAESIRRAIAAWADTIRPEDQLVVVLVGHGTVTETAPVLILPGPDLAARDLAESLDAVRSEHQVVLNFAGASGDFLKALARRGRVNVAATNGSEQAEPVLAEFFLRALETKEADGEAPLPAASSGKPASDPGSLTWRTGAKDGLVSVLEAYNWATHQTAMWILRQKTAGDAWSVEGRQSVERFKALCTGDSRDPGVRALSSRSDASKDDAIIPLRMKEGEAIDAWWIGRRTVTEHAVLEDCGQEAAVSALRGAGYEPLDGLSEGQPGFLARRTVIGRPELLPPEVAP